MGSQLFGALTTSTAVKVGYIDKDKGLVEGLTIAEANLHASKDPGTTFIFKSGDNVVRYMNINGVNQLTYQDTLRGSDTSTAAGAGAGSKGCAGVNQKVTVGPPNITLKGGGGIGAIGNPIVGDDGAILAVDVVRTGHGYAFPPIVTAKDDGNYGNGAVLRAVLGELVITGDDITIQSEDSVSYGLNYRNDGSIRGYRGTNRTQAFQYYDRADDYEEYKITTADKIPAGTLWGPNGEDLGEFNPAAIMGGDDPILEQVQEFEDIVRLLEDGFFNTRKFKPSKVSSNDPKVAGGYFHVDDGPFVKQAYGEVVPEGANRWGNFMNTYAISPKPPSNAKGSDFAGILFSFEWNIDFPTTGEYVIKGSRDNQGKLYIDNEPISDLAGYKGVSTPVKKFYEAGNYNIRLDLLNVPQYEKIKIKPAPVGEPRGEYLITYRGLSGGSVNRTKGEKSYAIRTEGASKTAGRRVKNKGKEIQFDDNAGNGFDENASLKIESTSPGVSAKFNGDGTQLLVKGKGDVSLKFSWDDNPRTAGLAVGTLKVGNGEKVSWTVKQKGEKGSARKTIKVGENDTKEVIRGLIVSDNQKKVKMRDGHGDDINSTFSIENSTNNARFSRDGKRLLYDGAGDIFLKLEWKDDPKIAGVAVEKIEVGGVVLEQKNKRGTDKKKLTVKGVVTSKNSVPSTETELSNVEVFNTVDYINKADRKLWRTNLYGGGGFLNDLGVCPFPTKKSLPDNPYAGTHVIRWEFVKFPKDGNYIIEMEVDDDAKVFIGNRDGDGAKEIGNGLRSIEDGGDEVIIEKKGFKPNSNKGTGKSTYTRFFKKGKYRIRTELTQKEGGRFSFDVNSNGDIKSDVKARFVRDGDGYALKVTGNGSAEIDFRLKTDDNPRTAGNALTDVSIGEMTLRRTRDGGIREKETINGSGFFEAGRTYRVRVKGSSPTTGARLFGENLLKFDDNIGNGFDENAELKIGRIRNITTNSGKGINPMAFAMRIRSDFEEERTIVSPKSWNQNPMGIALTIDAPPPTVPQEPPLVKEGRCPPNPIWTTRAPRGQEQWYPVTYPNAWSDFMDRYAMSPVKPLAQPNTDNGGIEFVNSWDVQVDFPGFYGVKAAADNFGSVWIDGKQVYKTKGFKEVDPVTEKVFLEEGSHNVEVRVKNEKTVSYNTIKKKVFSTLDWGEPQPKGKGKVPVLFQIYGQGSKRNCGINFAFTSEDGKDAFVIKSRRGGDNTYYYERTINVFPNTNYKVEAVSTAQPITVNAETVLPIEIARPGTKGRGSGSKIGGVEKRRIKYFDSSGSDTNASLRITSTSPGVSAKFSDDGSRIIAKGTGSFTLRMDWDDKPSTAGQAVGELKVGGKTFKQRGEKGDQTEIIVLDKNDTQPLVLEQGTLKRGSFKKGQKGIESAGPSNLIFADAVGSVNDNDDMQIRVNGGEFIPGPKTMTVKGTSGQGTQRRNTYPLTYRITGEGTSSNRTLNGVTYNGPTIFRFKHDAWSKFMNRNNVSPFLPPLDRDNSLINGVKIFTWTNVDFFEDGRYDIQFQRDNQAKLFIDNELMIDGPSNFRGDPNTRTVNVSKGKKTIRVELNNAPQPANIFLSNPTGFALKITKNVDVPGPSKPWSTNPMGISAMLIAPPCPRPIDGKGLVTDIIVENGGNGYVPPVTGTPGYPVLLKLKDVIVEDPGINYNCGVDEVTIEPSNGAELSYQCNTFGRIVKITVDNPGMGFTSTPVIRVPSETGVNFKAIPVFEIVRDPVEGLTGNIPPEKLIQVTDLVGLKQTGYYDGRPYYGAVFFKDGVRYAGYYETAGPLVQIYDTLQESIDGEVVTRPSAIQRQGTDTNSNNPRINLPGTPENLS